MSFKDILIHFRFPFSLFLLPVYLFGISLAVPVNILSLVYIGIALHVFLYPASNAFNSYYDKDTGPIGGIHEPPSVDRKLLGASLIWEVPGLVLLFLAGWVVGVMGLFYSVFSKAYSWDKTRWKRYPVFSLSGIALVQGSLVVLMVNTSLMEMSRLALLLTACVTAALFLLAVYPLTQVYQHRQDQLHGDRTYSMLVGIRGTFIHALICLLLSGGGFAAVFFLSGRDSALFYITVLLVLLLPALLYFISWMRKVWQDEGTADFFHTMRMNTLASMSLNVFFIFKITYSYFQNRS